MTLLSLGGTSYAYEWAFTQLWLLSALSPVKVWVGLKNSDDTGLRLDLLAEVFLDATKAGQGELDNVSGGGSGFGNALQYAIPLALTSGPVSAPSGAQLSIRLSARRTCVGAGHNSGTARLWYNGRLVDTGASRDAGTRFYVTLGGTSERLFSQERLCSEFACRRLQDFRRCVRQQLRALPGSSVYLLRDVEPDAALRESDCARLSIS